MSSPGWYPDPSGQPQSFRYWDGQTWSEQTTNNPYAPAPGDVAPPAAEPWGQQAAEQPQAEPWGQQAAEPQPEQPADAWGQQPEQPQAQQPDQAQTWGQQPAEQPGAQPWGEQTQQAWGQQPHSGAPYGTGEQSGAGQGGYGQSDYGQQGYGAQQTSQFAAQPGDPGQWGAQAGGAGFGTPPGQWGPMPTGGDGGNGGGRKVGLLVGGIVLALVLVVGIVIAAITLTGGDDDDAKGGDETSQSSDPTEDPTDSSESPSESPSESTEPPTDEPSTTTGADDLCTSGQPTLRDPHPEDGRLHGGGLSADKPKGYQVGAFETAFTFASDVVTVYREIEAKWVAVHALGSVSKAAAGADLETATRAVMACIAESEKFYTDVTDTKELASEAIEIGGKSGWLVRQQVLVDNPDVEAEGDELVVILVETGDADSFGFYNGGATIGDKVSTERLEQTIDSLTAD